MHYESPAVPKRTKLMPKKKVSKSVANVNKHGGRKGGSKNSPKVKQMTSSTVPNQKEKLSTSVRKGKKLSAKRCKEIASEYQAGMDRNRSTSTQREISSPKPGKCNDVDSDHEIEFQEGDQLIRMTVDKDDSFYESESDCSSEDSSDSSSDEETEDEPMSGVEEQDEDKRNSEMMYHQQRLKDIDMEMRDRVKQLHDCMTKGGLTESASLFEQCFDVRTGQVKGMKSSYHQFNDSANCNSNANVTKTIDMSPSNETVYKNAVQKRDSTSSEDDIMEISGNDYDVVFNQSSLSSTANVQPSTSRGSEDFREVVQRPDQRAKSPSDESARIVRDAKVAKAKIFNSTGEHAGNMIENAVLIDQDYLLVGNHVDESTQDKIVRGDYVDFGKLLPKDKVLAEEDGRMELIFKKGKSYWTPVTQTVIINNFAKWEQAFRIFCDIYTRHHPDKSPELIQYNHVIHSISLAYTWENVYAYDKEFRIHISKHPNRNWGVILQQAWSMKLRDRIYTGDQKDQRNTGNSHGFSLGQGSSSTPNSHKGKVNEPCRKFNKGKCKFGNSCRYEHRCSYCFKFGHNVLTCRKLAADRERGVSSRRDTREFDKPNSQ